MAYTLPRIGKALVKFLKPVRTAPPHLPGMVIASQHGPASGITQSNDNSNEASLKQGFRLLKFKKPARDPFAESKDRIKTGIENDATDSLTPESLQSKAPTQWIDLVVHLMGTCKRVTTKVRKRVGMESYRLSVAAKGRHKIKIVGSIVDTTADTTTVDETNDKVA